MPIKRGDMVTLNGRLAAVVGVEGDPGVLEEHVALWYGDSGPQQASTEGPSHPRAEVWTVPAEYCRPAAMDFKH